MQRLSRVYIIPILFTAFIHASVALALACVDIQKTILIQPQTLDVIISTIEPSQTQSKEEPKKTVQTVKKEVTKVKPLIKEVAVLDKRPQISEIKNDAMSLSQTYVSANIEAQNKNDGSNGGAPIKDEDAIKKYLSKVRQKIQNSLQYPISAKRVGLQGEVLVGFALKPNGEIKNDDVNIIRSSGSSVLDKSAIAAVKDSAPFDAPPENNMEVKLPVVFSVSSK